MRQYGTTLKATSGKALYRLSEPDFLFHGCTMLPGETKADFGEKEESNAEENA